MASNYVSGKIWLFTLGTCFALALAVALRAASTPQPFPPGASLHRKIMIVGVAHLVAKNDLHNSNFDDPMGAERQKQVAEFIGRLAAIHPTKVMIEQPFGDRKIQAKYQQYLKGTYQLDANEVYQFGFRLAAISKNPEIYPIDSQGFPFDYDSVKKSAEQNHQSALLAAAEARANSLMMRQQELVEKGTILDVVRFVNTDQAIDENASWYMYQDRVGSGNDYAGADLVAFWYARNLHIFANIMRLADSPDDRVVIFIGAGHVNLLKDCVKLSPDLEFVDPKLFFDKTADGL